MLYEHDLRVRLKERRNRLYKSDHKLFENELGFFVQWMESEPYIRALLAEIEAAEITLEEWRSGGGIGHFQVKFPNTEHKRAKVCLGICRAAGEAEQYAHAISTEKRFNDMLRDYVEGFVDPLVQYLEDRIDEGSAVLGILHRYKRRVEWFERAELHGRYSADTQRGEATLDRHLREYLLDQGIDFPFSQPRSPSGEADVVATLSPEEPLPLEVKLFGGTSKQNDAYIRKGFSQAVRYANDYGSPAGYLVVFNLAPELLVFEAAADRPGWPPSARLGDKTIFLLAIDVNPDVPSASQDSELARHEISQRYLLTGRRP